MNAQEILLEAAEVLEIAPWLWYRPGTEVRDCYCAYTLANAIELAHGDVLRSGHTHLLMKALGVPTISDIWRWNDNPKRKIREVIDLYRRAAELELDKPLVVV